MAFSYSDKNFTVIGNLCFVHILLDGQKNMFDIPPAIADRILTGVYVYLYPYMPKNKASGGGTTSDIGLALISSNKIICNKVGNGYLSFYFPIDSNK